MIIESHFSETSYNFSPKSDPSMKGLHTQNLCWLQIDLQNQPGRFEFIVFATDCCFVHLHFLHFDFSILNPCIISCLTFIKLLHLILLGQEHAMRR